MNILLLGSGGREHALAWAISASPLCDRLVIAPGNPGTAACGTNVPLDPLDADAVIAFAKAEAIDFVVVGPEAPLVAGLVDRLEAAGVKAFGPTAAAAQLEGSKGFTKDLCAEAGIPTARYRRCASLPEALAHLAAVGAPLVVKADGLAAGKGVVVAETAAEAEAAIRALYAADEAAPCVLEERMTGPEASVFALCDGRDAVVIGTAKDHKRAFDGDNGPNTGGMGAVSPAPDLTPELERRAVGEIVRPTLAAMSARGTPFTGVLYAGLMLTADGPKLVEYNVRFGDPECQALVLRLRSDLLTALLAARDGVLAHADVRLSPEASACVVLAARGYPGPVQPGAPIGGLEAAEATGAVVFHAGTAERDGQLVAAGGRVLGVAAKGATPAAAREAAYRAVALLDAPGLFHRTDIGN